jgi:CxxC-x17-CxxC domain-containing protein
MADFRSFDKDRRGGRSSGSRFGGRSEGRSFGGRDGGRSSGSRFGGGRGGFGGGRDSGKRDRGELPQCDAVCAKCGKNCKVPFKPIGDKPVYCKECFGGQEGASRSSGGSRDRRSALNSGISSAQFDQLNKKLDRILEILKDSEISV